MPNQGEQLQPLRDLTGVNLQAEARFVDPTSLKACENLFSESIGMLKKRPGSQVWTTSLRWVPVEDEQEDDGGFESPGDPGDVLDPGDFPMFASSINRLYAPLESEEDIQSVPSDPGRGRRASSITSLHAFSSHNKRINGNSLILGVAAMSSDRTIGSPKALEDLVFWIEPDVQTMWGVHVSSYISQSAGNIWRMVQTSSLGVKIDGGLGSRAIRVYNPGAKGSGSDAENSRDWSSGVENYYLEDDDKWRVLGLATDKSGICGTIIENVKYRTTGNSERAVRMRGLLVWNRLNKNNETPNENPNVVRGVQDLIEYNGTVALGGYQLQEYTASNTNSFLLTTEINTDHPHHVGFLDIDQPNVLHPSANIRVGVGPGDPVTALGIVTALNDSVGFRGQLAAFTETRMLIYDGIPPTSADDSPADFRNVISTKTGTLSPATVVNTTVGLVFLGSDGMVYLVQPGAQYPVRIGQKIQPRLRKLSRNQLRHAQGFFDGRFYRLMIPVPEHATSVRVDEEWWIDLYALAGNVFQESQQGVRWYGPMSRGNNAWNCAVDVKRDDALPTTFAGSATSATIYEETEDGFTDAAQDIFVRLESQDLDFGDAHTRKEFMRLEYGVYTKDTSSVDVVMAATGARNQPTVGSGFTTTVVTGSFRFGDTEATLGGTDVVFGFPNDTGFRLEEARPSSRIIGRKLKFTLTEESDSPLTLHDFGVGYRIVPRRGD